MKNPVKSLAPLAIVAFLSLAAGTSQAAGPACPTNQAAPAAQQMPPIDMGKIESALRSGQISPYEAGRLMRQQWEMGQFQRGFQEGGQPAQAAGGCNLGAADGDLGELAGKVAGSMAKNGIHTATKVMRALLRETERLVEEPPLEENGAF